MIVSQPAQMQQIHVILGMEQQYQQLFVNSLQLTVPEQQPVSNLYEKDN